MNRRNLLTAAAASVMLTGAVKAEGIPVTEIPQAHPDAVLIAACAAFCRAQAEFDVANATDEWDDAEINTLSAHWHAALNAVLASPPPTTLVCRVALARAARIALLIAVDDLGRGGWEENAVPEHRMGLMALSGLVGSVEA